MIPIWLILAVLAGLFSNSFNFFNRYLLRGDEDSTVYSWYCGIIRFVSFFFFSIFDWNIIVSPNSLIIFILLGLTEFMSVYWYMKMHEFTHLSISTILSRIRLLWVPLIAFFLLAENLKPSEYLGILILFIGISITFKPAKLIVDKGAKYANLAAFVIALNVVLTKMGLTYASNSLLNAMMFFPSAVLFPLLMNNPQQRIVLSLKKNVPLKTFNILLNIISICIFTQALRMGNSSKVTAVYQSMMVFSVMAGIIILGERKDIIKKVLGTVIVLGGVYLLS